MPKADIKFTNWVHYDCIAQEHNVELFDETFYEIFNEYLRVYIECGNNMLFVPLFTPPLDTLVGCERKTTQLVKIFKDENGYKFSLDALKKFIFFAMERGIEYIEFSHLFTQWGGECCPKIVASVNGKEQKLFGWDNKSDSVEYVEFLDAFLPVLVQEIQAWGIADKCYFHLTDEPKGEHLINYEKCRNIVKKHLGDLPIMDALSNYDFYEKGLVDIPVVCTPHYAQFKERFVENIFAYYCCWPSNDYYCNRLLNMPLQRTRILGFLLYQNNAKGFLHWGFNFYNTAYSLTKVNPYEDTSAGGMFPSGDSFIVYPTKEGVLLTIRAEASREAVQDYLLCKLAESFLGKQAVMQILEKFNIRGFNEYPRSIKGHNEIRQKIITAMQNKL